MLYLITYESAHWCGASDTHCVVRADSEEDALELADEHMDSEMRELFSDEYTADEEENGEYCAECAYSLTSIEEFDESHECWKYYIDPVQSQFFPEV